MANEVFKALGHPLRRQVMALLRQGPKSSGELAEAFDAAWPTVTRHLNVLKDATDVQDIRSEKLGARGKTQSSFGEAVQDAER